MGYIDSDTHVRESESTWDYLDPKERHHRPERNDDGFWLTDGSPFGKPFEPDSMPDDYNELFPPGSVDLTETKARLDRMDELGVDVQIVFPTIWCVGSVLGVEQEAALMRSWNRWMADRVSNGKGRLLWTLEVPFRDPQRALAEMEFGKEHGAVAVHLSGFRHEYTPAHPIYKPIYEKAQELELVIAIHTGGDRRLYLKDRSVTFFNNVAPVPGALYALHKAGIPDEFPELRWAFVEAGATWLPFALQEASRVGSGANRMNRDWRDLSREVLADQKFYVTCQIDDDLPYLGSLFGLENFVHGTDYTHMDVGSDPYGHHVLAMRGDVSREDAEAIVDTNGRRLWGIDDSFTPAPDAELRAVILEVDEAWTAGNAPTLAWKRTPK